MANSVLDPDQQDRSDTLKDKDIDAELAGIERATQESEILRPYEDELLSPTPQQNGEEQDTENNESPEPPNAKQQAGGATTTSSVAGIGSSASAIEQAGAKKSRGSNKEDTEPKKSMYNPVDSDAGRLERLAVGAKKHKKKIFGGGIVGVILAALFGASVFFSGPLQFVHFAQLLQQFHFANNEDFAESRMAKLTRYARDPSNPQNRRLGYLSNKIADRIELRMVSQGLQPRYNRAGYMDGFIVLDRSRVNVDDFRAEGFDVTTDGGRTVIELGDGNADARRGIRLAQRLVNVDGPVINALSSRILIKKAGVSLRWLGNIKRGLNEARVDFVRRWTEDRHSKVSDGITDADLARNTTDEDGRPITDEDGRPVEAETSQQARETVDDVRAATDGELGTARARTIKTDVGKGVGLVAGTCLVYGIASGAEGLTYENIFERSQRIAMKVISIGSQVMSGDEVDLEELALENALLYVDPDSIEDDPDTTVNEQNLYGGSWSNSAEIKAELGEYDEGVRIPGDMLATMGGAASPVVAAMDAAGIGTICKAASTGLGQVIAGTFDFFTSGGPLQFALGEAFGSLVITPLADAASRALAGEAIPFDVSGPILGSVASQGTLLAANETAIVGGAEPLTPVEVAELEAEREQEERARFAKVPLWERLFSVYDSRSFIAQLSIKFNYRPIDMVNPRTVIAKLSPASFIGSPTAFAEGEASGCKGLYEVPCWGWSKEVQEDPRFENFNDVERFVRNNQAEAIKTAKDCWNVVLDDNLEAVFSSQERGVHYRELDCTRSGSVYEYTGSYLGYLQTAEAGSCLLNIEDKSCENIGLAENLGSGSGTSAGLTPITGLESPPNLGSANSEGYYQMPVATSGEYKLNTNGGSPPIQQCGSKVLVDVTYTILKRYQETFGEALGVGDLNAEGHSSHDKGIDVDIYGSVYRGTSTPMAANDRAVQLGKWAYDTGVVQTIGYSVDAVRTEVNEYAGDPNFMQDWAGHTDHFHIRLNSEYAGPESLSCAS